MVSGLPLNAAQMFVAGFEPEYERSNGRCLARTDDRGFFWECNGERFSSEEVAEEGLKALADNVAR
jgi:hypothetical protein